MEFLRKSSLISIILICIWLSPIFSLLPEAECSCCQTENQCECDGQTDTYNLSFIFKDLSQNTHCDCSISENSNSEDPLFLSSSSSTTIKNKHILIFKQNILEEENYLPNKDKIAFKIGRSHSKPLSLLLLKSSFLL